MILETLLSLAINVTEPQNVEADKQPLVAEEVGSKKKIRIKDTQDMEMTLVGSKKKVRIGSKKKFRI